MVNKPFLPLLLLILLVAFPASAQPPSSPSSWTPRDDDIRILEIAVGPYTLEDVLLTYQDGTTILVPIGLLSELLDIAVESRPGDGIAEGFIIKEDRTFFLDTTRGEVTLEGKVGSYDRNRVHILPMTSTWIPNC